MNPPYTTDDFVSYDESSEQYVLKDGVVGTGLLGGVIGVRPGTIKLKDLDNSGTVDREDRKVIGNTNPDFTGGFSMNAMYHGFDASVMFSFVYGNDIYNANKIASTQKYRTNDANLLQIGIAASEMCSGSGKPLLIIGINCFFFKSNFRSAIISKVLTTIYGKQSSYSGAVRIIVSAYLTFSRKLTLLLI